MPLYVLYISIKTIKVAIKKNDFYKNNKKKTPTYQTCPCTCSASPWPPFAAPQCTRAFPSRRRRSRRRGSALCRSLRWQLRSRTGFAAPEAETFFLSCEFIFQSDFFFKSEFFFQYKIFSMEKKRYEK